MRLRRIAWSTCCAVVLPALAGDAVPASAAVVVATYQFQDTLAADQGGAPALVGVDPLGMSSFQTDTLYGHTRRVYEFVGNMSNDGQAGLSLDTTGLIPADSYSAELVFQFFGRDNAWRRIIDVQDRASDNGFYVNPSNNLAVFPVSGGSGDFTTAEYHYVVLTVAGDNTVKGYLDGSLEFTFTTPIMNVANPGDLMNFFLDNVVASGQGEYSSGRVGLIRLSGGVLTDAEVAATARDPFAGLAAVPEPATVVSAGLAALLLAGYAWRRRAAA